MSGCAQTSALSWATKIGTSPMMRMPRSRAACRTAAHCSKNRNCSNSTSRTSCASSRRAFSSAPGWRSTSGRSQAFHEAPRFARFSAMKSAKSASHAACCLTKASKAARLPASAFFSNASKAFTSSGRRCSPTRPKSTASVGKAGLFASSPASSKPCSASRSSETRSGLPANAENDEYGESP